jgi:putative transposase
MQIFLDDVDYTRFVYLLGEVTDEFGIECWNYCLMPNHYHATLRPSRPNLSEAIRRLNSVYAQWWNRRHERVGHVFQGRFKDQIVQREGYLLVLCRYVALNPVRADLTARPEDWRWSSYAATIGLRTLPAFLAASSVLRQFGEGDERVLQARFATYVLSLDEHDCTNDRIRSNERVLGSGEFKRTVGERLGISSAADAASMSLAAENAAISERLC